MKFQTILLLVAASAFVLAKPELSEDEVDDNGVMSEFDTNQDQDIPVENPIDSISSNDVSNDTQEDDIAQNDDVDDEIIPQEVDENQEYDDAANDDNIPQEDDTQEDDNVNNDVLSQEEGENQGNDVDDNDGEKSDDYGDIKLVDEAEIDGNEGEGSEDNTLDANNIDTNNIDTSTIDSTINNVENTNKQNINNGSKVNAMDNGEDSDDESNKSDITGIAVGIAGAAALSSAGIFIWVKRSKRSEVEGAPITMETVA